MIEINYKMSFRFKLLFSLGEFFRFKVEFFLTQLILLLHKMEKGSFVLLNESAF